jgi:hypothetical protein
MTGSAITQDEAEKALGAGIMNVWVHRKLSKLRPTNGEGVRTCGHSMAENYFFNASDRIDGLRWIALCRHCFVSHGHEPEIAVGVEREAA